MVKRYYIEIVDDNSIYALCEYNYKGIAEVFNNIKNIITNYNKNLCSVAYFNTLHAVRMLQEENETGTLKTNKTSIKENTANFLHGTYLKFKSCKITDSDEDLPAISVDKQDREEAILRCEAFVAIDIENKTVNLHYFTKNMSKEKFNEEYPWIDFSHLAVAEYSMDEVPFNAIEDFENFIIERTFSSWVDPHEPDTACSIES